MHEIFSREPDPLEGMLRAPSPTDNDALRQEVYTRTRLLLHRRRRWRQFAYAAALLISFAVGAGVMQMILPARSDRKETTQPVASKTEPQIRDAPPPWSDDSALTREWLAFDSENQRGELYRQAGDRYITEENDPQSALRCYTNALDNGTEQDLAISSTDSWLLMAIKDARQKENNHAKQGG
jgi:hypothetical protein